VCNYELRKRLPKNKTLLRRNILNYHLRQTKANAQKRRTHLQSWLPTCPTPTRKPTRRLHHLHKIKRIKGGILLENETFKKRIITLSIKLRNTIITTTTCSCLILLLTTHFDTHYFHLPALTFMLLMTTITFMTTTVFLLCSRWYNHQIITLLNEKYHYRDDLK